MARLSFNVNLEDVRIASYKTTKLFGIVDEFIESGADVAEYLWAEKEYKSVRTCYAALINSLKKRHIDTVRVVTRKDRVFLVRKDVE